MSSTDLKERLLETSTGDAETLHDALIETLGYIEAIEYRLDHLALEVEAKS